MAFLSKRFSLFLITLILALPAAGYGEAAYRRLGYTSGTHLLHRYPYLTDLKPLTVLVAVDTPELALQVALDYELKDFLESCSIDQNWIFFVNSHIASDEPRVTYCKNGVLHAGVPLKTLAPKVDVLLSRVRSASLKEVATDPIFQDFPAEKDWTGNTDRPYEAYPLTNPTLLLSLLKMTEAENLYPQTEFTKFVAFKSHAIARKDKSRIVLSGLEDGLVAAKNKYQEQKWREVSEQLFDEGIAPPKIVYGQAGSFELSEYEIDVRNAMGLGPAIGPRIIRHYPDHTETPPEGPTHLEPGELLGTYGLGDERAFFGMSDANWLRVLNRIDQTTVKLPGRDERLALPVSFALLEACDANVHQTLLKGVVTKSKHDLHINTVYAPVGALPHRNLNWKKRDGDRRPSLLGLGATELHRELMFRVMGMAVYVPADPAVKPDPIVKQ